MRADRVLSWTQGSQGPEVTRNTRIYQSVKQKGDEAPTISPPRVKDSNLDIQKTVICLCTEVPPDLPIREKAETY